jgi:hypothetical protein
MAANKKKIIGITIAVLVLVPTLVMTFLYQGSYSTGIRAGIITKISHKGYLFKTWEGELNLGMQQAPWAFSVDSGEREVIKVLEDAAQTGERVKLHYEEKFVQFSWRGDTKYFVTRVERLGR